MVDSLIFFNTIIVIKNDVFISFSDKVYEGDFTLGDHDSELIIIWYLYIHVCNNFNFEKEQACAVASLILATAYACSFSKLKLKRKCYNKDTCSARNLQSKYWKQI